MGCKSWGVYSVRTNRCLVWFRVRCKLKLCNEVHHALQGLPQLDTEMQNFSIPPSLLFLKSFSIQNREICKFFGFSNPGPLILKQTQIYRFARKLEIGEGQHQQCLSFFSLFVACRQLVQLVQAFCDTKKQTRLILFPECILIDRKKVPRNPLGVRHRN